MNNPATLHEGSSDGVSAFTDAMVIDAKDLFDSLDPFDSASFTTRRDQPLDGDTGRRLRDDGCWPLDGVVQNPSVAEGS